MAIYDQRICKSSKKSSQLFAIQVLLFLHNVQSDRKDARRYVCVRVWESISHIQLRKGNELFTSSTTQQKTNINPFGFVPLLNRQTFRETQETCSSKFTRDSVYCSGFIIRHSVDKTDTRNPIAPLSSPILLLPGSV